jgi:hypothetical protein
VTLNIQRKIGRYLQAKMKRIVEAIVIAVARGCSHCRLSAQLFKLRNGLPHTEQSVEERMIVCGKVSAVYHLRELHFLRVRFWPLAAVYDGGVRDALARPENSLLVFPVWFLMDSTTGPAAVM